MANDMSKKNKPAKIKKIKIAIAVSSFNGEVTEGLALGRA